MAMPRTVRVTRDGVEFVSNIDRAQYTLTQLEMAGLREVGKFIRKMLMQEARLQPGMKKSKRVGKAYQYWARKKERDLQIGIKHNGWYGVEQEMGTNRQRKKAILTNTVFKNIDDIRRILGIYIAGMEDENKADGLIGEDGGWGPNEDE